MKSNRRAPRRVVDARRLAGVETCSLVWVTGIVAAGCRVNVDLAVPGVGVLLGQAQLLSLRWARR